MRPNNAAEGPRCSTKLNPSFTPLMWGITLLVVGPIWILARVTGWLFSLPEQVAFHIRVWAARLIGSALAALRMGGR